MSVLGVVLGLLASAQLPSAVVPDDGGEQPATVEPIESPGPDAVQPPAAEVVIVIPALTPVRIELMQELGSRISTSLDQFPIRLAEPIVIGGLQVIPAGTPGMGEVVHAKKRGGIGGTSGELVLAARYLDLDGQRVKLRSLRFDDGGKDRINTANVATALVGVVGFFVKGEDIVIPAGTVVDAKTAAPFVFVPREPDSTKSEEQTGSEAPVKGTEEVDPAQ